MINKKTKKNNYNYQKEGGSYLARGSQLVTRGARGVGEIVLGRRKKGVKGKLHNLFRSRKKKRKNQKKKKPKNKDAKKEEEQLILFLLWKDL